MTGTQAHLDALRTSIGRLRAIVEPLDDSPLGAQAYPSEWTIAQVLSTSAPAP